MDADSVGSPITIFFIIYYDSEISEKIKSKCDKIINSIKKKQLYNQLITYLKLN